MPEVKLCDEKCWQSGDCSGVCRRVDDQQLRENDALILDRLLGMLQELPRREREAVLAGQSFRQEADKLLDRVAALTEEQEKYKLLAAKFESVLKMANKNTERRSKRVAVLETALREIAGYTRAHLAGNNADPELQWALGLADEALSPEGER